MTMLESTLQAAANAGDDVIRVELNDPFEVVNLDEASPALVVALEDEHGRCLVMRAQIAADGDGVSFVLQGFAGGEPIELEPLTLGGQVSIAL